jgi:hypothetical protein
MVAAAVFAPIVRGQQGSGLPVAQQFESLHYRSIGPASMSGRISDFAVYVYLRDMRFRPPDGHNLRSFTAEIRRAGREHAARQSRCLQ